MAGGLVLAGLGGFLVTVGLDRADKWSSVIGAFAALVGLGLAAYSAIQSRLNGPQWPEIGAQLVDEVDAGEGVTVVDSVAGNLRIGAPSPTASPNGAAPATPLPLSAAQTEQAVTNVRASGAVHIIRGVRGHVDIDS